MPAPQSDLAQQLLKDPYNFDFLTLSADARERDLERGLLAHLRDFLLELGVGFAFVGSQYPLTVAGEEYSLDLLFYHLKLRCFVVAELKMGRFEPEHVGKMNFYLSAVDDQLRHPDDGPSIGLILCKTKNEVIAEYALRDTSNTLPRKFLHGRSGSDTRRCGPAASAGREQTFWEAYKPIGVSAYQLTASLPEPLQASLPTIEDLEAELRPSPPEKT